MTCFQQGRLLSAAIGAFLLLGHAGRAEVGLDLQVPPANTYVIGDPIPLIWRFENKSRQALGFLWEGCCRLNGRLDVRHLDREIPALLPGQALAHMFAKADRLEPGVPKEYTTMVSDWVILPDTGRYQLRGTYRGVLPTQEPQVPRGLALWRDAAESSPIEIEVLSPRDYLSQQEARSQQRGLHLTLQGPSKLPPLAPALFRLSIENLSGEAQELVWPDNLSLWILDAGMRRSVPAAVLAAPFEQIKVPPHTRVEREFQVNPDQFEGESLGQYHVFVDLAEAGEKPRVPSNLLPLAWTLGRDDVAALLESAAKGAGTGARNAPLKRLRVYLAEVGPDIEALASADLTGRTDRLAKELAMAARLKPLAPRPGPVNLYIDVPPTGAMQWTELRMRDATRGTGHDFLTQVTRVVDLRRHLGWDIQFLIKPADATSARQLIESAEAIAQNASPLRMPVEIEFAGVGTNTFRMGVTKAPVSTPQGAGQPQGNDTSGIAIPTLRVTRKGTTWSADGVRFEAAQDDRLVRMGLEAAGKAGLPVRVEAEASLPWADVRAALARVIRPGDNLVFSLAPSSAKAAPN